MCDNCKIVKAAFEGAKNQPHLNYPPLHAMLSEMLKQRRLELYAGDCPFDEMTEVLEKETHYTVCSYLRCSECGTFFFFGACIRGEPKFKEISDITAENIDKMLWGREGEHFK